MDNVLAEAKRKAPEDTVGSAGVPEFVVRNLYHVFTIDGGALLNISANVIVVDVS